MDMLLVKTNGLTLETLKGVSVNNAYEFLRNHDSLDIPQKLANAYEARLHTHLHFYD